MGSPDLIALAAAALLVERSPERVLEVDCGQGERTLFLAREFPRASVRGVDASEAAIHEASARVGLDPEGRIAFKVAHGGELPFPDDHFDLVAWRVSGGMREKLARRRRWAEVARVLRPGGTLIGFSGTGSRNQLDRRDRRRLARQGFEAMHSGGAGGGAYIVARLQ